jgi:2'-5' RNA ligase
MTHLAKADVQSGAMVALYPSPATATMLAQPGGEAPEDLHVTLAFLGDAADITDPGRLLQAVAGFAATVPPLAGEVSGAGTFTAGPEPCTYASIDLPGLPMVRERLIEALCGAGCEPSTAHGFTPHMTLAYDARQVQVPNLPLVFDAITVAIAGQRTSFPLSGVTAAAGVTVLAKAASASIDPSEPTLDGKRAVEFIQDAYGLGPGLTPHFDLDDPVQKALRRITAWITMAEHDALSDSRTVDTAKADEVSAAAWNGSPAHFTDDQWKTSCILDRGATYTTAKTRYALPVREPGGTLNRRALASAQAALNGGRGGVKAPPAAITAAKATLGRLRDQAGLTTKAEWHVPIWKADDTDHRVVYGVVLHPGVTDSQGDDVSAEEIEQAAHRYLVESRKHDLQHAETAAPVEVVESYIAPADLEVAGRPVLKGSWVMASHIRDDAIWAEVQTGAITGYSIGGSAVRT